MTATNQQPTDQKDGWVSRLTSGCYSVSQATQLLRFSKRHVRSYARLRGADGEPWSERPIRRERILRFRDLMELRVARTCHALGMPWRDVCNLARYKAAHFEVKGHRLSNRDFLADGCHGSGCIPLDTEELTASVNYDARGIPVRWNISREWGIETPDAAVVIDPRLSFGSPIMEGCHVPTYILHDALMAEDGDYYTVAEDYEVSVAQVRLAYRFEIILQDKDAIPA